MSRNVFFLVYAVYKKVLYCTCLFVRRDIESQFCTKLGIKPGSYEGGCPFVRSHEVYIYGCWVPSLCNFWITLPNFLQVLYLFKYH
ncbi:hypothetical protein HanIR_Chr16g0805791 [Helianthus annuus]|nr:hypothetical protein HanIR_Chr16g0805791 [Helianthus annuus]